MLFIIQLEEDEVCYKFWLKYVHIQFSKWNISQGRLIVFHLNRKFNTI